MARALEVPMYRLLHDGEPPASLRKLKPPKDDEWGEHRSRSGLPLQIAQATYENGAGRPENSCCTMAPKSGEKLARTVPRPQRRPHAPLSDRADADNSAACCCVSCQKEPIDTRAFDERAIREADGATLKAAQANDVNGAVCQLRGMMPPGSHPTHPLVHGQSRHQVRMGQADGQPRVHHRLADQ